MGVWPFREFRGFEDAFIDGQSRGVLGQRDGRIADLHPGEAKTDARDACIIAQAARTLAHALRSIQLADEQVAELSMLCGFDDDVLAQIVATSNRIRGLLTQIHPALERVLGPHPDHPAVLDLLQKYPRYLVYIPGWCEYLRTLARRVRHDYYPQSFMIRGVLSPGRIGIR